MCGRVNVIDNPGIQQLLKDLGIDLQLPPGVNVAPTEGLTLLRDLGEGIFGQTARWWLTPSWAPAVEQKYAMFNARSETLQKSRAYRKPFASQRGIVPVSSFLEWRTEEGVKQPWLISTASRALLMATLWDVWEGGDEPLLSCTLVTTAAAPAFEPWHKRMPVLLDTEEAPRWLDNSREIASDDPLFRPELKQDWLLRPLDRAVSNARNKAPELMRGLAEPVRLAA